VVRDIVDVDVDVVEGVGLLFLDLGLVLDFIIAIQAVEEVHVRQLFSADSVLAFVLYLSLSGGVGLSSGGVA